MIYLWILTLSFYVCGIDVIRSFNPSGASVGLLANLLLITLLFTEVWKTLRIQYSQVNVPHRLSIDDVILYS